MEQCIYCGCDQLETEPGKTFTCPQCGLQLTHDELFKSCSLQIKQLRQRDDAGLDKADDYGDEEETLASVWQLMQKKAWEKALTILLPSILPTEHPMEFAVWRNICRLAPVLTENNLTARYQLLDLLQHNLERLDYFISSYPSDKRYLILQKLYQALMLLGSLDIQFIKDRLTFGYDIDTTNRRRAKIIIKLAEALEALGTDSAYGTEYLKMSVRLYNQSLDAAREYSSFVDNNSSMLNDKIICLRQKDMQMSGKTRRYIGDKITQLNAAITQRDAGFIPEEKSPDPKIMPYWLAWSIPISLMSVALLIPFINMLKNTLKARGMGDLLPDINDVGLMVWVFVSLFFIDIIIMFEYDNSDYIRHFDRPEQTANAAAENAECT